MIEIVRRTNLATLLPATIATGHDDLVAIALDPAVLRRTAVLLQRKGRTERGRARVRRTGAGAAGGETGKRSEPRPARLETCRVMKAGFAPDRGKPSRQLYPRIATAATSGRSIVFPTSDVIGSCSTA